MLGVVVSAFSEDDRLRLSDGTIGFPWFRSFSGMIPPHQSLLETFLLVACKFSNMFYWIINVSFRLPSNECRYCYIGHCRGLFRNFIKMTS